MTAYIAQFDALNAAACLACPVEPDCIYCLDEPPLELRRMCPIWVKQNARNKPYFTAWNEAKKAKRTAAKGGGAK